MSKWEKLVHPPLPHEQAHSQSLGGDGVLFLDVTLPYRDDYSSHSYPVPNLSIPIVKKHFQEADTFFSSRK